MATTSNSSPTFVTIRSLLNNETAHVGIAIEVERRGVYSLDLDTQAPIHHRADSIDTELALNSLSVDLRLTNPPPNDDGTFETWWNDQDVLGRYGWPSNSLPVFRTSSDDWSDYFMHLDVRSSLISPNLYTIGRLLLTGRATAGDIGTAMERDGIYGYDRLGRLRHNSTHSTIAGDVHLGLRKYVALGRSTKSEALQVLSDAIFSSAGWPEEHLPDFNAIAAEPVELPPYKRGLKTLPSESPVFVPATPVPTLPLQTQTSGVDVSPKSESAFLAIIGGLLAIIRGELNCAAHPDFSSQQNVIDQLTRELDGLNGTKERNLKERLKQGRDMVQEHLDPGGVNRTS